MKPIACCIGRAKQAAGHFGYEVAYIKGEPVEVSRKPKRIALPDRVQDQPAPRQKGIFRFVNEDGNALSGFQPNRKPNKPGCQLKGLKEHPPRMAGFLLPGIVKRPVDARQIGVYIAAIETT